MKTSKSYNGSDNKGYNGHRNYNQWNQSLWINNDEGLYSLAKYAISYTNNRKEAVDYVYNVLMGGTAFAYKTPDGVKWSKAGIRAALVGM